MTQQPQQPQQQQQYAVPAPAVSPFPQLSTGAPGPAAPSPSTDGMKTPQTLDKEKTAYHKALEQQLSKETEAVAKEGEIQKQMVTVMAKNQIAQFTLQIEEQLKLQCMQ